MPIETLLSTERLVGETTGDGWLDKINDNFRYRFGAEGQNKTANYTLVLADASKLTRVDPTSGAVTITTPAAATCTGVAFLVEALNVTNTVTLDGNSSETINGSATKTIGTAGRLVILRSDGTNWNAWYYDRLP